VPLVSARWDNAPAWYVAESHGALTNNNRVLAALDDILLHGTTQRLDMQPPAHGTAGERQLTDADLRRQAVHKVRWESLSLDSRRRILEPVLTPEFLTSAAPPAVT
jgi:hypothetical protein